MAGGEFRLATDSIYMAEAEHTASGSTSPKFWITWLRFRPLYRCLARPINGLPTVAKRKLALDPGKVGVARLGPQKFPHQSRCSSRLRRYAQPDLAYVHATAWPAK